MTAEGGNSDGIEIPDPHLDEGWEYDVASQMEEEHWGELDRISAQKKRNELGIHRTIGYIVPIAITIAFILFLVVLGVYVAHLILPTPRRWLTPDELAHIHNMLFSGVVGGAVAVVARTYLLKD